MIIVVAGLIVVGALIAPFVLSGLAHLMRPQLPHRHGRMLATRDHAYAEVEAQRAAAGKKRSGFRATLQKWLAWVWTFVRYRFTPKHPLEELEPGEGTFEMRSPDGKPVRVAVTGDWGKGDVSARRVAELMGKVGADYTIHLGDIYSVGSREEVDRNFLGEDGGVRWPEGRVGTLAVPGNHEYQSGAHAFYDPLMSSYLGVETQAGTHVAQPATYWSLESEHWQLVGLDTGYHSVKKVFWELTVRLLNLVWRQNPLAQRLKTRLPDALLEWLRPRLAEGKGLVFLSHHQFVTTLDNRGSHPQPGEQIDGLLDGARTAVWLCGHGHRLEIHGAHPAGDEHKLTVLSRTVGHGAETDVVSEPDAAVAGSPLRFADNRLAPGETKQGFTGFAILTIDGPRLAVDYVALRDGGGGEVVYREAFEAKDGSAVPVGAVSYAASSGFLVNGLPASATELPVVLDVAG